MKTENGQIKIQIHVNRTEGKQIYSIYSNLMQVDELKLKSNYKKSKTEQQAIIKIEYNSEIINSKPTCIANSISNSDLNLNN